jgi:hypothetical protein
MEAPLIKAYKLLHSKIFIDPVMVLWHMQVMKQAGLIMLLYGV